MGGAPCWCLALRLRGRRGGEANREPAQYRRGGREGMIIPGNPPGKGGEPRAEWISCTKALAWAGEVKKINLALLRMFG